MAIRALGVAEERLQAREDRRQNAQQSHPDANVGGGCALERGEHRRPDDRAQGDRGDS